MDIEDVLQIIVYSVPVYSSITGLLLMMLTYRDCISRSERRIKFLLVFYYIFSCFTWMGTISFYYSQSLFVYLNPFFYLSLLLTAVILYHFIFYLTATRKAERFSMWHYLPPMTIFLFIFIWSLFIPYDTQYAIVLGNNAVVLEYRYYSVFYISKHSLRIIYLIIFIFLSARRLYSYSKAVTGHYGSEYKKYILWLWYILGLGLILVSASIITILSPYTHIHEFLSNIFIVLLITTGHGVLAYNIIRRNYYLTFIEKEVSFKREPQEQSLMQSANADLTESKKMLPSGRQYVKHQKKLINKGSTVGENLTKKQFELYFKESKPYLNPDLRITDLIEIFEVNRTYISRFVNREYGMNFSRYVNRCRLQKMEILTSLASNNGKNIQDLLKQAGFGSYRSYMRAKQMEEEEINKKKRKK